MNNIVDWGIWAAGLVAGAVLSAPVMLAWQDLLAGRQE